MHNIKRQRGNQSKTNHNIWKLTAVKRNKQKFNIFINPNVLMSMGYLVLCWFPVNSSDKYLTRLIPDPKGKSNLWYTLSEQNLDQLGLIPVLFIRYIVKNFRHGLSSRKCKLLDIIFNNKAKKSITRSVFRTKIEDGAFR